MSNQLQENLHMHEAAMAPESPATGDLNRIQLVPRITVQAFCETDFDLVCLTCSTSLIPFSKQMRGRAVFSISGNNKASGTR